jgi:hypothetical protein
MILYFNLGEEIFLKNKGTIKDRLTIGRGIILIKF